MDTAGTPLVAGDVLYETFVQVAGTDGELAAFDATGTTNSAGSPKVCQPLWTAPINSFSVPSIAGGRV